VGSKRQLLPELMKCVPPTFGNYYEPFVGGGALFFTLASGEEHDRWQGRAFINDFNRDLWCAYTAIQQNLEEVIALLGPMKRSKTEFERVRALDPNKMTIIARGVRAIYLLKCCFNGVWRENKRGQYNVPFAKGLKTPILDEGNLRDCHAALMETMVTCLDFEAACDGAQAGDFVYFDPPYLPLDDRKTFTSFTSDGFSLHDQIRLFNLAKKLKDRGVYVLLSNSGGKMTRDLYGEHFELIPVRARRNINSDGAGRGAVKEYLIR
jgi:DNA adenine methylase